MKITEIKAKIKERRERAEKVTPGPWCWERTKGEYGSYEWDYNSLVAPYPDGLGDRYVMTLGGPGLEDTTDIIFPHSLADGNKEIIDKAFIAHARTDVPDSCDELEYLIGVIERINKYAPSLVKKIIEEAENEIKQGVHRSRIPS